MRPSSYFYAGDGLGEWCVGVFDNYEDGLVLGTVNLMDRLVTFDRANGWVGFTSVDCATYDPHAGGAGNASRPTTAVAAVVVGGGGPSVAGPAPAHTPHESRDLRSGRDGAAAGGQLRDETLIEMTVGSWPAL